MTYDLTTPPQQPFRTMRLAVIGAGWLGGSVGGNWVRSGHEVMFSSRHPAQLAPMAKRLGPGARTGTPEDAAAFGEAVLLSVPYEPVPEIAAACNAALAGKILLDACNPPWDPAHPLALECEAQGVGPTTQTYFPDARVVRCFSAVDASDIQASYRRRSGKLGSPIAGDDPDAVALAAQLVYDAGCEPLLIGGLSTGITFQRGGQGYRVNDTLARLRAAYA